MVQIITKYETPGTYWWEAPSNISSVYVACCGAAAGGTSAIGSLSTQRGWQGGAPSVEADTVAVTGGLSYAVVVGAGGTGGVYAGYCVCGTDGGNSSFTGNSATVTGNGGGTGYCGNWGFDGHDGEAGCSECGYGGGGFGGGGAAGNPGGNGGNGDNGWVSIVYDDGSSSSSSS